MKDFFIHKISSARTIQEATVLYRLSEPFLPACKFVLASDLGVEPGFSVNQDFSAGAAVRSLFHSKKVWVLDKSTLDEMGDGPAVFPIDYSISLDTQALSYLEPFIAGNIQRVPEDYAEVFRFISQDNVFVDPIPYCHENLRNISADENTEKIFDKLKAYEVLRNIDEKLLAEEGIIRSKVPESDLVKGAQEHMGRMYMNLGNKKFMDTLNFRHQFMYCLLLKMALIQLNNPKKSTYNKIIAFMDFCDEDLATLGGREIAVAKAYFEKGQGFAFFGKIQKSKEDIFEVLDGMAWDLWHVRFLEEAMTISPDPRARYFFPSILTFDKRFIEVIDLYPLKSLAYVEGENRPMPFYDGDWFSLVEDDLGKQDKIAQRYYSTESVASRDRRRSSCELKLDSTVIGLEEELNKLCPKAKPLRKRGHPLADPASPGTWEM
ncbi:hypothetical protein [Pseudomonas sp. sia0905]|uniref:hypothetical protein n=1 Tax=Pseudomonas sp. sia0905 TaxID=2854783 RepID=UPI001C43DA56|nr:hypothetical protein [Pseudomonas sp. sia0905]MBV7561438.1 hypothetical protein [Pseudomonas sp. sia0905]